MSITITKKDTGEKYTPFGFVKDVIFPGIIQEPTRMAHHFDYYGNRRKQGVEPAYKDGYYGLSWAEPIVNSAYNWLTESKMGRQLTQIGYEIADYVKPGGVDEKDKPSWLIDQPTSSTTYIPSSNSAAGVAAGTSETSSALDSYLTYLDEIKKINEANNAFNVEQAQKQMDFQREQNKIFMDFNALEAQKSRDWQTEMSNTAYQRQVADMQAAGLNPVLAASGGNGASIGSGTAASATGAASGSRASADNLFGSAMLSMMNSAMNIAEKSATSAITASAVAAKQVQNDSPLSFKDILKDVGSFVNVLKGIKGLFS